MSDSDKVNNQTLKEDIASGLMSFFKHSSLMVITGSVLDKSHEETLKMMRDEAENYAEQIIERVYASVIAVQAEEKEAKKNAVG